MTSPRTPDADEILAGIFSWTGIETHTPDAEGVNHLMDKVAADYQALGASVERIPGTSGYGDHLSVRSPWTGTGKCLLILSHLDTVHPKGTLNTLPMRVEGDNAYGPGIYDMKGGAYLGYTAMKTLIEAGTETPLPVRILYTADEEIGSPTSQGFITEAARDAAYVLVTEPARDGGKVVTSRKGVVRFVMTVHGVPAHSGSRHHEGRSAIRELARQILALEGMTDYGRDITVNVGMIEGGTGTNVIPAHARATIDIRVPSMDAGEEMIAAVHGLMPTDPDIRIEVSGGLNRPPFERLESTATLFEHAKELAADIGFELMETHTGGGSDGNFTAPIAPTLDALGVDGEGAHTLHEHLFVSSLVPRMRLLRDLMTTLK